MIKELKTYTVLCNNCKQSADEGSEYSGWGDESQAYEVAENADYIVHEGLDICPDCYSYGEDDEIIINESRYKTK